jgi:nitrite reductase/ring-hydroxylating ferredoxin subunit
MLHFGSRILFCYDSNVQSFDTHESQFEEPPQTPNTVSAGRIEDFPEGTCKTIELSPEREIALYRVNGEFYATENFCPHKGAPLAGGKLCDHVIECEWHGWQFDVRTGQCLTVREKIATYAVVIEEGHIKVLVRD